MVEKFYGDIPAQPAIPRSVSGRRSPAAGPRTVTLPTRASSRPACGAITWLPSSATAATGESPAARRACAVMGSGSNSYLFAPLVIDRPARVTPRWLPGHLARPNQFQISVSAETGAVEFSQIEQTIDGVISDLAQNLVRAEDSERVKTQLIAKRSTPRTIRGRCALVRRRADVGLNIDDIRSWPDRIAPVTADQVRDAAQKWLDRSVR